MASHLATPMMLAREVLLMLPLDAVALGEELTDGGVLVTFTTCGGEAWQHFDKHDRLLSLNAIREIYKPLIDASLHTIWAVN